MALINFRNAIMVGKRNPPGVPYVECLNNTACLCHTDLIASQSSPWTISAWLNIASTQPSLSEGRTICLTGTTGSMTAGLELGMDSSKKIMGAFIQQKSYNIPKWDYANSFDSWHNFVITYNGSTIKTYLDGTQKSSTSGSLGTITSARFGIGCLQWYGSMISGGPMGKYANVNYWDRILSAAEIADVKSAITYIPTDAAHRYDMNIQNGRIADVGIDGGWDFTTIRDFENGVYVPEAQ